MSPDLRIDARVERHAVGDLVVGPCGAELGEVLALELQCARVITGQEHPEHKGLTRLGDSVARARLRVQLERLRLVLAKAVRVTCEHGDEAEVVVAIRAKDRVAGLLGERESLLVRGAGCRSVIGPVGETADGRERIDLQTEVRWRRDEEALQHLAAFSQQAPLLEPAPDRRRDAEAGLRVARPERPGDRRADVVLLTVEAANGGLACGPEDLRPGVLGQPRHGGCVPGLDVGSLAGLLQPFERVLAEQRMEVEARFGGGALGRIGGLDPEEALIGERLEALQDFDPEVAVRVDDGECQLCRPAARERGEPAEEPSLRLGQQVVAPRDGATERALALRQVA